jgi:phenylalanyl-tRNA synthetase beta chain
MKFTLSWLKDHLDTTAGTDEIGRKLTDIGLEVESITDNAKTLAPFTVAFIKDAVQHPQADKLRVCTVEDGTETRQIVCGAANARAGIKVVLAREGVTIPANGMVLKKTKIRGVDSNGMLCSLEELSIPGESSGIYELPTDALVGESIVKVMGLDDALFDIAITPNRSDCLGVRGIARDLAAAGVGTLKPLSLEPAKGSFESSVKVSIEDETLCPMFVGITIKGVKNGSSPQWLQKKLQSVGLRPISTLVDITNLFTLDLSRPLHVYDIKKLNGNIKVGIAKQGETLAALNDKTYELDERMCAIKDDSGTIGLGGIVGGVSTGVDESTTDVFLECALFTPARIMETGRRLSINSDARYRFERGVDAEFVEQGALLAASLIQQLCGGEISNPVIAGKSTHTPKSVALNVKRVQSLSGVETNAAEAQKILQSLGFSCSASGDSITTNVPSFRPDIDGEADLVEEIVRIKGYAAIPSTPLPTVQIKGALSTPLQTRVHLAKRLLATRGLLEVTSWAFMSFAIASRFGEIKESLELQNPIADNLNLMRPNLLPNLLLAVKQNADRGMSNLALFEVGAQFEDIKPEGQKIVAAGVRSGTTQRSIYVPVRDVDAMDAKADAFAALETIGVNTANLKIDRDVPAWYHPARSGRITMGGKILLGYFGELHPSVLRNEMDIRLLNIVGFELFLENIPTPKAKATKAKPMLQISAFQKVERDFAFMVDSKLEASNLIQAINASEKTLITSAKIFDVFSGKGVEEGKKSVAICVTLQANDRTLTDAEIEAVAQKVIGAAASVGATLRQ